jgi:hypothetical protein
MKRIFWIVLTIAIVVGAYYGLYAYRDSIPLPTDYVKLEFPLKNGKYIIMQSGKAYNIHTSPVEKYALDIVKESNISSMFKFKNTSLENGGTYGTSIYSPCKGVIRELRDGIKDQPIGIRDLSVGGGNILIIGCDGFDVLLAHIKSGTFKVKIDDVVELGEELAQIGNSGNTDGPHLHIMAYRMNGETERIPLPMVFNGKILYRFDIVNN